MKWKISIISTFIIWATFAGLIVYWHKEIPLKLNKKTVLATSSHKTNKSSNKKNLKEIIDKVQKVVVTVELEDGSLGSGFLYNKNGDVITNAHVVNNSKKVKVKTADSRELEGTVIGISTDVDVAVVRVPGLAKEIPLVLSKKKAEIGDEILALGSPLGLQNTVTTGIISGVGRNIDIEPFHYSDVYQISAPITNGNSGGPLVNSKTGQVLGINSAGTDKGSIGFSIPIVNVFSLINGWSETPMTELPTISSEGSDDGNDSDLIQTSEDSATYLVNYYYESVNSGDYVTAYSLLGSNWKAKTDFASFRNGYLNTTSVSIDDLQTSKKGESYTVIGILSAEERKNGDNVYSKYKVEYTVGLENDQLRMLSGKAKKIE